jgi:hypothetical protein
MYYNYRAWVRRGARRRARAYEERIIDGSVEESFPASDPSSSSQPGSIAAQSYAFARRHRREADWIVPLAVGVLVLVVLAKVRRRR